MLTKVLTKIKLKKC